MSVTIKLRGNTEAYWQSANPVPADREVILSTDKGNFKVGDGATAWASLGYWLPENLTDVIKIVGSKVGIGTDIFGSRDKLVIDNNSTDYIVGLTAKTISTLTGIGNAPVAILANNTNTLNSGVGLRFASKNGNGVENVNLAQIFAIIESESVGTVNYGGLRFTTTNGSTIVTAMIIENTGNVGLGATIPATKLDISSGAIEIEEMTPPSAPAANNVRIYAKDNGSGKTQLTVKFSDGTETILATQP